MSVNDLLFVGLNGRVAALHRGSGKVVWEWKASKGSSYVTLLHDGGQLFVSVDGYTYCLNPETGDECWMNPLKGYKTGPTSLATVTARSPDLVLQQAAHAASQAAAAASASGATGS